jgi:hypothetical protein
MVQGKEFRNIQRAAAVGLIALAATFVAFMTISADNFMSARLDARSLVLFSDFPATECGTQHHLISLQTDVQETASEKQQHLTTMLLDSHWHPLRPEHPYYFPDSVWLYAGPEIYFHGGGGTSIGDLTYIIRRGHYQASSCAPSLAPRVNRTPARAAFSRRAVTVTPATLRLHTHLAANLSLRAALFSRRAASTTPEKTFLRRGIDLSGSDGGSRQVAAVRRSPQQDALRRLCSAMPGHGRSGRSRLVTAVTAGRHGWHGRSRPITQSARP